MGNESKEKQPSPDLLKRLYGTAGRFREIGCWNWMWDSDLFGVQNPADGEIAYCCVMGRRGEHFAIAAYLGSDGLQGYYKLRDGDTSYSYLDAYLSQKCLVTTFEDRNKLNGEDKKELDEIGYIAKGPHAWPTFRSHSPGLDPWHVNAGEAEFLMRILEQAMNVALRFKENPDMLTAAAGESYLVRVSQGENGGLKWTDTWVTPVFPDETAVADAPMDEVRLARIRKNIACTSDVWEIDSFYAPGRIVGEGKRPYFPRMLIFVDHDTHMILGMHAAGPAAYLSEFPQQLMHFIEKAGIIPARILTGRTETARMLEPVASRLGIGVELTTDMNGLMEAVEGMFEYFAGTQPPGKRRQSPGKRRQPPGKRRQPPGKRKQPEKSRPIADFEGLSPKQMHVLLHSPFDPLSSPLVINTDVDDASLKKVRLFDHILRYIDLIREREPIRLTQKGNLPVKIVREIRDAGLPQYEDLALENFPLRSEEDAPYIHLIDMLTRLAGFTRKLHGRMMLTARYKKSFARYSMGELYRHIFEIYTTKYNWAYEDVFEGSWIIQGGFAFSLLLVHRYGREKRNVKFYSGKFLRAFPAAIEDFDSAGTRTSREIFESSYFMRVFEGFMQRFGLINITSGEGHKYDIENKTMVKSGLFDRLITWKSLT